MVGPMQAVRCLGIGAFSAHPVWVNQPVGRRIPRSSAPDGCGSHYGREAPERIGRRDPALDIIKLMHCDGTGRTVCKEVALP